MSAEVLSFLGEQDAIRYGEVRFSDGATRRYRFDLIADGLLLYEPSKWIAGEPPVLDEDPIRKADALKALRPMVSAQRL